MNTQAILIENISSEEEEGKKKKNTLKLLLKSHGGLRGLTGLDCVKTLHI